MEKNFDVEIQEDIQKQPNDQVQLPMNFISVGEIENDDIKVYIKQDVYKSLEKYALEDVDHERGTIILGDFYEDMGKTFVIISNYIEAKYTDASASTLTFTHKTWDYVNKEHDEKYSNKKIVGWQHTHPNYGIFLSNYDVFIQENFFNLPFQLAYVIDPIQNIRGFFQWKNGKIEKLKGFYIYDDIGKAIKIEQKKIKRNNKSNISRIPKGIYAVISILCVVSLVLSGALYLINSKYNEQLSKQNEIIDQVKKQKNKINKQQETIDELQNQLVSAIVDGSGITTAKDLIEKIESNEIALQNQKEVLDDLKSLVNKSKKQSKNTVKFKAYTVENGDTLYKICQSQNVDYSANKKIIISINGISNPNNIFAGQMILLPVE